MKIAIIGPIYPYRGGISHYTARLAQALTKSHDVRVFSFKRQYPAWLYPGRSDKDPSNKTINVEVAYTIDSLNPVSWLHTVNKIREYTPDVLIIEWWVTFLAPAFITIACLCRHAKIPVVFLIHNVLPHENSWLHRPLAGKTLKLGNSFIVHTSLERERLLALVPHAIVEVCPFPVYDMIKPVSLTQIEARQRLKIPETGHVMLFFGIVRPYKGLNYLLEALAMVRAKIPDLYLVVAGEFWENKESYRQKIEELGLSMQVRLEDRYIPDDEVGIFFRATDLAVAPYVGGTQSAVSALAMGFGTPLVATKWSAAGINEVGAGKIYLVPAGDADALADAIQAFFENTESVKLPQSSSSSSGWETIVSTIEKLQNRTDKD